MSYSHHIHCVSAIFSTKRKEKDMLSLRKNLEINVKLSYAFRENKKEDLSNIVTVNS